jgi:NADPH:quinone reductase-like Zn-dependent oxidoreductase
MCHQRSTGAFDSFRLYTEPHTELVVRRHKLDVLLEINVLSLLYQDSAIATGACRGIVEATVVPKSDWAEQVVHVGESVTVEVGSRIW